MHRSRFRLLIFGSIPAAINAWLSLLPVPVQWPVPVHFFIKALVKASICSDSDTTRPESRQVSRQVDR